MAYETLNKLYYKNRAKYDAEYERRYGCDCAVHVDFDIGGSRAFFLETPEAAALTRSILRTDKRVAAERAALPGKALKQFTFKCLTDEIVLTNSIEGVRSTRREIGDILDDAEKSRGKRMYGLVQKYLMLSSEDIPLDTCEDIRSAYDEMVLQEVTSDDPRNKPDGRIFRKDCASIDSPAQKEIHRGVYPEAKIIASMEKALVFVHDETVEPLYRIAIFHYLFEYIHPFYDGNGRLGRFLCSDLLVRELDPLIGYRLSYTIKENLRQYYEAFKLCNDPHAKGDMTPFLLMFLQILDISMRQLLKALAERHERLDYYAERIGLVLYSPVDRTQAELLHLLIQASLFSEEGISTADLLSVLKVSKTTLTNKFSQLPEGLLDISRVGRSKYYKLYMDKLDTLIEENGKAQ